MRALPSMARASPRSSARIGLPSRSRISTRRRGGYCFEQNQLFLRALQALGFDARPLLARVWLGTPPDFTPPRTHTLNLVTLDGELWIADAGFGGSYTPPMPLIDGHEMPTADGARHRLRAEPDHGWLLERRPADEADWQAQYSFTTDPVFGMDLVMANHYTATAYQTRFTTFVVASIATADGFASLVDKKLSRDGAPDQIADASEYRRTLDDVFGIQLTDEEVARLKLFDG